MSLFISMPLRFYKPPLHPHNPTIDLHPILQLNKKTATWWKGRLKFARELSLFEPANVEAKSSTISDKHETTTNLCHFFMTTFL